MTWTRPKFSRVCSIAEGQVDPRVEPYASMKMVAPNHIESGTGRLTAVETAEEQGAISGKYLCQPGDVIYSKIRPGLRKAALATEYCLTSADMYPLRPAPDVDGRYLAYYLLTDEFSHATALASERVAMPKINRDSLNEIRVPKPPLAQQRAIADFLDTETARIDALITKKRRMIDLLEERQQASIDGAVEGAGTLISVRHVVDRITSGPRGWSDRTGDHGAPFLRIANVQRTSIALDRRELLRVEDPETAEAARTRVAAGDVLVSITADIGSVAVATDDDQGGFVSQHIALITPTGCESEWLAYAIKSTNAQRTLDSGQYGGTKTQLSLGDIAGLKVPCPSPEIRKQRLRALRAKLTSIESARKALASQLHLLDEHRQALITAAVTGELAVPGVAA